MNVVVVESPAKAKTINKYLGKDFVVLASYGHVRDLPARDGSVRPDEDFAITYEIDPKSAKHLNAIAKALKSATGLYLATDPDREGEAISWHVLNALRDKHAVGDVPVKRVVFNEITRSAVLEAMRHPRDLDMDLINAQQARRALDYLVGFTLSPVLWRKLPGSRSAGRVQSVALRLICEREMEIEAFRPREYWTVEATMTAPDGRPFQARLVALDGQKLTKFELGDAAAAHAAKRRIEAGRFACVEVDRKPQRRHPSAPFTTSTLQQEASRKLGFNARRTMQVAQRLYEGVDIGGETVGLVTYMRTDGVQIAQEAVRACRSLIARRFGEAFVPEAPRTYRAKAKNAQEAHEAIRPTDLSRLPEDVAGALDDDARRLYELVWQRTVASQMESARIEQTGLDIRDGDGGVALRATGSVVQFPGFLKLYQEGRDDGNGEAGEDERSLPAVAKGDALGLGEVLPSQHFTEPPPRFTEATLVKRLEELGIGRPSTYASIISVLQDRDYVRLERGRFVPEDRGRLVTAFLTSFFRRYVEYDFTADLENRLDEISAGQVDWKRVLDDFWRAFSEAVSETQELRVKDVLDALDAILGPHVFHGDDPGVDARHCPACGDGRLSIKLGRYGAFIGCGNYPTCRYTRPLGNGEGPRDEAAAEGPRELGLDAESDLPVSLRKGPYGHYVQLGENGAEGKPKRVSLPAGLPPDAVDLATALKLLALPRELGKHPETGHAIIAGIGRYGPYLRHERKYHRLPKDEDVLSIGLNRAVTIIADTGGGRGRREPGRVLGSHPDDGAPVTLHDGRYGPYVSHNRVNATIPKGREPQSLTLDEAVALLRERAAKGKGRAGAGKSAARKAPRAGGTGKPRRSPARAASRSD